MDREYIKIKKPPPFPIDRNVLETLNDDFWKSWIFYHLLDFYQNYDRIKMKDTIKKAKQNYKLKVENEIAKFIRNSLNLNYDNRFKKFGRQGFIVEGGFMKIKSKIHKKLQEKFDTTPNGDLTGFVDNSIENNNFTFDSYHSRNNSEFVIHHLLFDICQ